MYNLSIVYIPAQEKDKMAQDDQSDERFVLLHQLANNDDPDAWGTMEELDAGLRALGWLEQ